MSHTSQDSKVSTRVLKGVSSLLRKVEVPQRSIKYGNEQPHLLSVSRVGHGLLLFCLAGRTLWEVTS